MDEREEKWKINVTLFNGPEGICYNEAHTDAAGKNLSVNLSPIADFFNANNSFLSQISKARREKILTSLRYTSEKIWENSKYSVVEFVTDDTTKASSDISLRESIFPMTKSSAV